MKVIFIGNAPGFSDGFLNTLADCSADPDDRVELVAVVAPMKFESRLGTVKFRLKRRLGLLAAAQNPVVTKLTRGRSIGSGPWQRMQDMANHGSAPMMWPDTISNEFVERSLSKLEADIVVVAGLNHIFSKRQIEMLPAMFNFHPSLLPDYRGSSPDFWQLNDDVKASGITIHLIDEGIDSGSIVEQLTYPVEPWMDAAELELRAVENGQILLKKLVTEYPAIDRTAPRPGGSYQPKVRPEDLVVPFELSARDVYNRARGAGWQRPLTLHVEPPAGRVGQARKESNDNTVEVQLFDPIPFPDDQPDVAGTVRWVLGDGMVVTCNTGSVFFRRCIRASP